MVNTKSAAADSAMQTGQSGMPNTWRRSKLGLNCLLEPWPPDQPLEGHTLVRHFDVMIIVGPLESVRERCVEFTELRWVEIL
jgi:hypothetical protein